MFVEVFEGIAFRGIEAYGAVDHPADGASAAALAAMATSGYYKE